MGLKILVVSDRVTDRLYSPALYEMFPHVDLILSAGDLPYYYLEYIESVLNVPLFYVHGNHDPDMEISASGIERKEPQGCQNLHARAVECKGLLLCGFEGSKRYNNRKYQYTESQMEWEKARMAMSLIIPTRFGRRKPDFLLTHAPSQGLGDLPTQVHSGFRTFRRFLDRYKPSVHVHGHVHLYDRNMPFIEKYHSTTVLNAYGYKYLNYDPKTRLISVIRKG